MKHHIIVKWNDGVTDKKAIAEQVRTLFSGCAGISGVACAELYENCVDRENRYDLMIVIDMESDALAAWDASELHKRWKRDYGSLIERKAIFDCD